MLKISKKGKISVESLAVCMMCTYTLLTYCAYINSVLMSLQSLCLMILLGVTVLLAVLRRHIKIYSYVLWYGTFFIYSLFSVLYASDLSRVLDSIYGLLIVLILCFAMSQLLQTEKRIELLMQCFVVGSIILLLYMVATGKLDTSSEVEGRLGNSLTGNSNLFASIIMFAACASVYFAFAHKAMLWRSIYLGTFALQVFALILSGGRKFLLVPFLVAYLVLLLKADKKGRKHVFRYTILGVIGVLVLYYLLMTVPFLYDNIGYRFESFLQYSIGQSTKTDGSTLVREQMRVKAFELWLQAPILGHGLGMFAQISGFGVYSHCNYVELLCNNGIIGAIFYYAYWVYLLIELVKLKQKKLMRIYMIAILLSFLFFDYGAVAYMMPQQQFYILMVSMYLYLSKRGNAV